MSLSLPRQHKKLGSGPSLDLFRPLYTKKLDAVRVSNPHDRTTSAVTHMNAQTLAEIGSWIAIHATAMVHGEPPHQALAVNTYWTASKCRLQRWAGALKMFERDVELDSPDHDPWPAIEIVVQEILLSDLLTRVFSATLVTHDVFHDSDELRGLAHGIHIGHIEAKNRALRIMLKGQAANERAFENMNALRRRIERWTDLFLAQLPRCKESDLFAFDLSRRDDFRRENRRTDSRDKLRRQQVFSASLASDLKSLAIQFPANPELNRQIAAGVISCFAADRFDSFGLPKSASHVWMEKTHLDTQLLVDHLIEVDRAGEHPKSCEMTNKPNEDPRV